MKRSMRALLTVLSVPLAAAFLQGCPKKVETADTTPPSQAAGSAATARTAPGPGGGSAAGGAMTGPGGSQQSAEQRTDQLLASRGEDIPIREAPAMQFVEPSAEDKLILKTIYFEYDKSTIRPEYQTVLEGVARWLQDRGARQLLIEGHCDERGTDEYNLALGERRSLSVRRYLIGLGIASDRLHTISYGEEKPADMGHDESAWEENRRAEFKVSAP